MNPSSGTVGPTPAEQTLSQNAQASFADYSARYLPMQAHLASVVDSMSDPKSWQNQEAEGKGNVDVAQTFAASNARGTAASLDRGINVGSGAFKMRVAGSASAEATTKGAEINTGHEAIQSAYLSGLQSLSKTGESLATAATGGMSLGGEVASREAISNAQTSNAINAGNYGAVGFGVGILGQTATSGGIGGSTGGGPMTDLGGGYGMQFQQNMAQGGGLNLGAGNVENLPGV